MKNKRRMEHFHSSSLESDIINIMMVAALMYGIIPRELYASLQRVIERERE